jgi:hypothetical protein
MHSIEVTNILLIIADGLIFFSIFARGIFK